MAELDTPALKSARDHVWGVVAHRALDEETAMELFWRHEDSLRAGPDGSVTYLDDRGKTLLDPRTGNVADTAAWLRRIRVLSPHLVGEAPRPETRVMNGPDLLAALADSIEAGRIRVDEIQATLDNHREPHFR